MKPLVHAVEIARPADVVAAQFADVAYHERAAVHRSASFELLSDAGDVLEYNQRARTGRRVLTQRFRLDRRDPKHLVNTVLAGPLTGATLTFDIEAIDADSTRVTATLELGPSTVARWFGALLRRRASRDLARALLEDRDDLESGRYQAAVG